MKKLLILSALLLYVPIFSQDYSSDEYIVAENDFIEEYPHRFSFENSKAVKAINFNQNKQTLTVISSYFEEVKEIYLYDTKRNLIRSYDKIKKNKELTINTKNIYLINIITNKEIYWKRIST